MCLPKLLLRIRSKPLIALAFCAASAVLSAFLDALTVIAVVISVAIGFYTIYHKVASGKHYTHEHDHTDDEHLHELKRQDLDQFRAFLRSLMMHAAIGTALGGVCTLVGEPQNLIIGQNAGWGFVEFATRMAPVTIPTFFAGLATCFLLEKTKLFGYGTEIPERVRTIMIEYDDYQDSHLHNKQKAKLIAQAGVGIWLIIALGLHIASVGLIGLSVIILATVWTGVVEEHQIGKAFEEALALYRAA